VYVRRVEDGNRVSFTVLDAQGRWSSRSSGSCATSARSVGHRTLSGRTPSTFVITSLS
jgi:hypothetical protein